MASTYNFLPPATDAGIRLDKFLAQNMPTFSRTEIQKFKVSVNGAPARSSYRLKCGDNICVEIPDILHATPVAYNTSHDFDLDILYEDDDIIVINKPRGIVMYPSAGNKNGTLVQNVLSHTKLSSLGGDIRPGVVHRLDKDTSGVIIFAKSDSAYRSLTQTFSHHDLTRRYVAFVWGIPTWSGAQITGNIARSSRNRQKMSMVKTGGKPAHTIVNVMDIWPNFGISAMRCTLMTGRTHQIRVHLSSHGFPVLCDPLYGRGSARLGTVKDSELLDFLKTHAGQMLHAEYLGLKHPTTGQQMVFKAPLPSDMLQLKMLLGS